MKNCPFTSSGNYNGLTVIISADIMLKLRTPRLELVAGDAALTRADLEDRAQFARLLVARVPDKWPPPLNDEQSMRWIAEIHAENPEATGWGVWYFVKLPERVVIGNGGFKGAPAENGSVEVGYSVLEEHQNSGFGTEALQALIRWAFSHSVVTKIVAETFPDLKPSIRILEKSGFVIDGIASEPGAIKFVLPKAAYQPLESR